MATASVLVKKQTKTFGPKEYTENGQRYRIIAIVRYDDQCGNGHNSFSITGNIDRYDGYWRNNCGGCIHDEITKHFPELESYIKWHLCSSDGPMHYIANTVYHADEHGPTHAWVYFTGHIDPCELVGTAERLIGYYLIGYYKKEEIEAKNIENQPGYRIRWNEETAKVANLDYARSSAIWPEATDDQLRSGKHALTLMLQARLPKLMEEFRAAVESLGFIY